MLMSREECPRKFACIYNTSNISWNPLFLCLLVALGVLLFLPQNFTTLFQNLACDDSFSFCFSFFWLLRKCSMSDLHSSHFHSHPQGFFVLVWRDMGKGVQTEEGNTRNIHTFLSISNIKWTFYEAVEKYETLCFEVLISMPPSFLGLISTRSISHEA